MAQEQQIHATFVKGATAPSHFPESTLPEVAMIGRSNVGKSSLINAIVRHGQLARVSNRPGKTQEINFFRTDVGVMLVDLPGYGYARVSKAQREEFSELIKTYLFTREQLHLTCVLVDSRHDPQALDMAMMEELEFAQKPFVVILTKCDKLSAKQANEREEQIRTLLGACTSFVDVVRTSSKDGEGRMSVIGIIKKHRTKQE